MNYEKTYKVLAALEEKKVHYTIFGGVALNLHGLARATEDLDLFVEPDRANIDRLREALHVVFEDPHIDEIQADDLLGDYPAVQYVPPEGGFHIDILTRLGEAFVFCELDSQRVDFSDLNVNVVTPRMLFEMKKATIRPIDQGDAARLQQRFGFGE